MVRRLRCRGGVVGVGGGGGGGKGWGRGGTREKKRKKDSGGEVGRGSEERGSKR